MHLRPVLTRQTMALMWTRYVVFSPFSPQLIDLTPHQVVPCSALDITQESVTYSQCGTVGALDEITVDGCQGQGSIEDESVSLPVLTSSAEVETQASHEFPVEKSGHSIVPALVVLSPENVTHSHGPELDSVLPNIPVTSEHSTTTPDAEPSLVPGGPPLLLHSDPVCSFGSLEPSAAISEPAPFTEVIDNTTTQGITAVVLQPALNSKAATFVPRPLPIPARVAVLVPAPSLEASEEYPAHTLQVSIHAPTLKPASVDDSKDTSLKASMYAPLPKPALSDPDFLHTPEAHSLRSSIQAPALDIDNSSEVLHSSIHAPGPRPALRAPKPPNPHPILSPTARPFLFSGPKFFAQNYSSTRITIAPAPPRKHRGGAVEA
ncbi:hypothetical protein BDZ94DRAFT_1053254 [Collybia nuda]|uniref:Uncharacterized protein n=1 Tax=Collybia nuda TaxID=64659 RepID=A0A9P5Y0Q9_9AGAR|nr:hypothetical protein BDZ94DRAFT_1053254 [Collybia nuda]